jgi:hypothetical protein
MFTSEQLGNMMPKTAPGITTKSIWYEPLNDEALEVIRDLSAEAAKGDLAGIIIYLSREYQVNRCLNDSYQSFYEADKVIEALKNPELKLDIITKEDNVDQGIWVYIKWVPGNVMKHIGSIRVNPEPHVIEYLTSIRPALSV